MQPESVSGSDIVVKLREYATRERNSALALADAALRTPRAMPPDAKARALEQSSYYRARQNSMSDILRLLSELAPAEEPSR